MKNILKTLALAAVAFAVWGCYPGSVSTSELDTVITVYDDSYDFKQVTTFHIPDSIIQIGEGEDLSDKFDQDIIDRTRQNLESRGYQYVSDASQADFYFFLEKTSSTLVVVTPPPCYWCWYPGYPGYPPYYPWYPPGYVYTYPIGTIFGNFFVPDEANEEAIAVWGYRLNGLVTGSDSFIQSRLDKGIDQAFTQSSYLGK